MNENIITDSIPHRGPMLLVDEVLELSEQEIVCRKTFRAEEHFFQGHYPDHPLVPGVILCECAAQSGAILLANHHLPPDDLGDQVPVLTRLNKVRFKNTVHPGDAIEIRVRLDESISGAFFLSASIRNAGKLAASLELACTLAPKPSVAMDPRHQLPNAPQSATRSKTETAKKP